jgi:hypothetical protein
MCLKTLLSALLVAALLSMSYGASACAPACAVQTPHSCCPAPATLEGPAAMSVSQENPAAIFSASATSHHGLVFLKDESQSVEQCSSAAESVALAGRNATDLKFVEATAVSPADTLPHLAWYSYPGAETASARFFAIRSTPINLRI